MRLLFPHNPLRHYISHEDSGRLVLSQLLRSTCWFIHLTPSRPDCNPLITNVYTRSLLQPIPSIAPSSVGCTKASVASFSLPSHHVSPPLLPNISLSLTVYSKQEHSSQHTKAANPYSATRLSLHRSSTPSPPRSASWYHVSSSPQPRSSSKTPRWSPSPLNHRAVQASSSTATQPS